MSPLEDECISMVWQNQVGSTLPLIQVVPYEGGLNPQVYPIFHGNSEVNQPKARIIWLGTLPTTWFIMYLTIYYISQSLWGIQVICIFQPITWDPRGLPLGEIGVNQFLFFLHLFKFEGGNSVHGPSQFSWCMFMEIHMDLDQREDEATTYFTLVATSKLSFFLVLSLIFFLLYAFHMSFFCPYKRVSCHDTSWGDASKKIPYGMDVDSS